MVSKRFYHTKPPTILDVPVNMQWEGSGSFRIPKRPSVRAASASRPSAADARPVLNALSDALGDEVFRRAPVNADTILTALEDGTAHATSPDGAHLGRPIPGRKMAVIRRRNARF
jgi:xanthine dehydrogenase molybdenum-binding subunit